MPHCNKYRSSKRYRISENNIHETCKGVRVLDLELFRKVLHLKVDDSMVEMLFIL